MSKARPNIPKNMKDISKFDMEFYIEQSNLGIEDTKIAKMYLIDKIPQIEIAEEVEVSLRTVCSRCKCAVSKISHTIEENIDFSSKENNLNSNKVIYLKDRMIG